LEKRQQRAEAELAEAAENGQVPLPDQHGAESMATIEVTGAESRASSISEASVSKPPVAQQGVGAPMQQAAAGPFTGPGRTLADGTMIVD